MICRKEESLRFAHHQIHTSYAALRIIKKKKTHCYHKHQLLHCSLKNVQKEKKKIKITFFLKEGFAFLRRLRTARSFRFRRRRSRRCSWCATHLLLFSPNFSNPSVSVLGENFTKKASKGRILNSSKPESYRTIEESKRGREELTGDEQTGVANRRR